jgi:Ala-tRNA(Pro) deacylase
MSPTAPQPETAQPGPTTQGGPAALFAFLERLGIATRTVEHPPVYTVEESQALRGTLPGGHAKNLFLKDRKDRLFLVVAQEDARIDLKRIHEVLGASGRVSFGSAELLRSVLGVEPGSVTPLAAMADREGRVTVAIDRNLLRWDQLNVHPLVNTMTTAIARDDLLAFLKATGHEPLAIDLPVPPEPSVA